MRNIMIRGIYQPGRVSAGWFSWSVGIEVRSTESGGWTIDCTSCPGGDSDCKGKPKEVILKIELECCFGVCYTINLGFWTL